MTSNKRPGDGQDFTPPGAAAALEQRQANVLGDGPRIAPLQVEDLSEDLLMLVAQMSQINAAIQSRDPIDHLLDAPKTGAETAAELGKLPEIVRTMLRHPDLFARQTDVGVYLLTRGALAARDRELAILRMGWLCQAPYEWGEHVIIGKKVGLSSAEIERITQGSQAPGWSEHERAILCAVEELYDSATISDATWAILATSLDDKQLIELPVVIGQYQTVAYYQNALRLALHNGNDGLKAR